MSKRERDDRGSEGGGDRFKFFKKPRHDEDLTMPDLYSVFKGEVKYVIHGACSKHPVEFWFIVVTSYYLIIFVLTCNITYQCHWVIPALILGAD